MTDLPTRTIVKSLRIDPQLWLRVIDRAAKVETSPNRWVVRAIKDTLKRVEAVQAINESLGHHGPKARDR